MSNISEITANSSAPVLESVKNSSVKEKSGVTNTNYGKTIGKAQLSEEGAKYYEELKKKFGDMDFVLVSKDMKNYAKQNASSFGNANRMVVLIDEEKIERMATDSEFRAKYEGLIAKAQNSMPALKALAEQSKFAISQHVNGAYWTPAEAFGAELEGHSTGDLQTMLDQLVEQATAE